MSIRNILAPLSGGAATAGAAVTACRLAAAFGAHVEGLTVTIDPSEALPALGPDIALPIAADLVELARAEGAEKAAAARKAFDAAAAAAGLAPRGLPPLASGHPPGASAMFRQLRGWAPAVVARRARLSDLVVLGQSGRVSDQPFTDTLEAALIEGGRPVFLAPAEPPAEAAASLPAVVAVAWNGSVAAARAVAGALPFLAAAREIHVLADAAPEEPEAAAGALVEHLAWHGIAALAAPLERASGIGPGERLLAAARERGAGLLVMGGYGRSPWRELVLGGATREVVATSRLPVLLAH